MKRRPPTPFRPDHLHLLQIIEGGEMVTGAVAIRVDDDQFQVGLKSHYKPEMAREQVNGWVMMVVEDEHEWLSSKS